MRRNPRVTLLCYDPRQPLRYLEVRGMVAEMTEAGAAGHLDCLASKYAGRRPWTHSTVVVFPAPFGPRMPKISPACTSNDRSSTATTRR